MKIGYFDTSFILSILFKEPGYEDNLYIWRESNLRFSSVLLKFEGLNNIRKQVKPSHKNSRSKENSKARELFYKMMDEVNFLSVDDSLFGVFSEQESLLALRTLDVIHLVSILKLQKTFPEIILHTLDDRMLEVSEVFGIKTS